MRRIWVRNLGLLAFLGAAACDDSTSPRSPDQALESELDFVTLRMDAPPLATTDTSFWAVAGEFRQLIIAAGNVDEDVLTEGFKSNTTRIKMR